MPLSVSSRLPVRALASAGLLSAVLAGCASSTGGNPASATRTATADVQDPVSTLVPAPTSAAPSDGPSAAAAPAPSVAPKGSAALPGVPAVMNATDLTKQPVLAAGTGSASTGLVTRDLVVGSGAPAAATDTVIVKYVGVVYSSAKIFDASWTDPDTAGLAPHESKFGLSGVVPGFASGIVGMKPGGRREIVIPAAQGYGPQGGNPQAGISATDTIVFVVDFDKLGAAA